MDDSHPTATTRPLRPPPHDPLDTRRLLRSQARADRDAAHAGRRLLARVALRAGAPPRAVLGLLLVAAAVLAVLGGRVLLSRQTDRTVTLAPAALTQPPPPPAGATSDAVSPAAAATVTAPAAQPTSSAGVVVDVVGQVRHPGVVHLAAGARVLAAVQAAGGPLHGADLAMVNLARVVGDGEQVVVPKHGQAPVPATGAVGATGGPASAPSAPSAPVDLNTADATGLDALPGVGPVLAQRILDWRGQHGRFATVDELGEVSGIGDATLARLRPLVSVS